MGYTKYNGTFPSCDGIHRINYGVFVPDGEIRGVIQISHGMCEYFGRYTDFASYLTDLGFVVCGNDHLGHGESVNDDSELGWFGDEAGWECVVKDLYSLTKLIKAKYPDKPYFLFGHSMGSFLARAYVTRYGKKLDGVIFCGTGGGMDGIPILLAVVEMIKKVHGGKYRSKFVDKLAFGMYNSRIEDRTCKYDWVSRDTDIVERYSKDPKCNYIFTLNGFENLAKVLWYVNAEKWFETYPKDLPTYLIAGSADPVGDYGRGVLSVYNRLVSHDCNVELKIYEGARHELVNEICKEEVYGDIAAFYLDILGEKLPNEDMSTDNRTENTLSEGEE